MKIKYVVSFITKKNGYCESYEVKSYADSKSVAKEEGKLAAARYNLGRIQRIKVREYDEIMDDDYISLEKVDSWYE